VVIWVVEAMADPRGDGDMPSMDKATKDTTGVRTDLDAALDPAEPDGVFRDSRECAALALLSADTQLLLSPPTPRPKKG
jgi:hypothetical protein